MTPTNAQINLFEAATPAVHSFSLPLPGGDAVFFGSFFSTEESDRLLIVLEQETKWRQEKIKFYGKEIDIPRLTAWYGDSGKTYTYSGIRNEALPWTPTLALIKDRIEAVAGASFNSVLLNFYRSGKDGVAWHSDDEPELGPEPTIGSVSFGGTRCFQFKSKIRTDLDRVDLDLTHGSLLVMRGLTQRNWQHQIPKTKKPVSSRINLTFRKIAKFD